MTTPVRRDDPTRGSTEDGIRQHEKFGVVLKKGEKTNVEGSISALASIIRESLIAFPNEAHQRVYNYLLGCGLDESNSTRFQQVWTKCYLASQAFGQSSKGREAPIDPVMFARDIIHELSGGDKICLRLRELDEKFRTMVRQNNNTSTSSSITPSSASSSSTSTLKPGSSKKKSSSAVQIRSADDFHKAHHVLASLESMRLLGEELTTAFEDSYSHNTNKDQSPFAANNYNNCRGDDYDEEGRGLSGEGTIYVSPDNGITEAVMQSRRSARFVKVLDSNPLGRKSKSSSASLQGKSVAVSTYSSTSFSPIDAFSFHGFPDMIKSTAEMKIEKSIQNSTVLEDLTPIVKVKISAKQPVYQERGWAAYQFYYQATHSKTLNIFPQPVGVTREADTSAVVFMYENPPLRTLSSLLGPPLAVFLRQYPSVILTWAGQLGRAYDLLNNQNNFPNLGPLQLVRDPRLEDIYVREGGTLLLGNMGFIPASSSSSSSSTPPSSTTTTTGKNENDPLAAFVHHVLSTILCLSRVVSITLNRDESKNDEIIVPVIEGSTLHLNIMGENSRSFDQVVIKRSTMRDQRLEALSSTGTSASSSSSKKADVLKVEMICEKEVIGITTTPTTSSASFKSKGMIHINALQPGNVLLRAYIPRPSSSPEGKDENHFSSNFKEEREDDEEEEGEEDDMNSHQDSGDATHQGSGRGHFAVGKRKRGARDIRIVVVPAHPICAVALQELIALLEATFHTNHPVFMQAKCFRTPDAVLYSDELRGENDMSRLEKIHNDWVRVQKKLSSLSL